jgi:PAS domain S-box-containing protein
MQKILAIDDKVDNLVTLTALLKHLIPDCAVITAQSGMEGIEQARAELPDTILLDVKMQEMDGFETCRRLMSDESTKHIPVIVMTAIKTDPESRIKGLEIGANAFLTKPIDQYELVSQLKVALRIKKAEDALREERNSLEKTVQERTASLRDAETRYRMLFEHSPDGILIIDPATARPLEFNETAHRQLGYSREEFSGLSIFDLEVSETPEETRSRIARVIHEGRVDFETRQRTRQGEVRNVHVTAQIIEALGRPVYHCVWRDITDRRRAEEKLKDTLESLRKAVGATIQVMVSAVEVRDPYTAGHQIRSADLARAIATEMGFTQDTIDGIRMAGSIHDIGKLSIPAEILSKPTKLSELEFSLIKEHARKGFEMLKDVESPWPLAEIVYQHHERMDGSGYPRNLKGDDILMEARILAVADVVEAMASHRPYRPGLGIDAALEEIARNRTTLYDSEVVDACLNIFNEKGYKLSN